MTYPQVWSNSDVRALPVGQLRDATIANVLLGRRRHFRTGPWVALEEDDSRIVQVVTTHAAPTGGEPAPAPVTELLFARPATASPASAELAS